MLRLACSATAHPPVFWTKSVRRPDRLQAWSALLGRGVGTRELSEIGFRACASFFLLKIHSPQRRMLMSAYSPARPPRRTSFRMSGGWRGAPSHSASDSKAASAPHAPDLTIATASRAIRLPPGMHVFMPYIPQNPTPPTERAFSPLEGDLLNHQPVQLYALVPHVGFRAQRPAQLVSGRDNERPLASKGAKARRHARKALSATPPV